uniref:F-box domain-containing protein n=1 Tax=Globodera pallida TaxID=36090 RepID=A0A183CE97_GLOPA
MLPCDTFKIYKKGSRLRVDLTLIGISDRGAVPKWERGDVSLLLDMTATDGRKAVLMDHQKKVYQVIRAKSRNLSEELDCLMSTDISSIHISTRPIHFVQAKSLLLFPKSEYVGKYKAYIYHIKGMQLVTQKRREHLSEEDLKLNREMQRFFTDGNLPTRDVNTEGQHPQHQRPSLAPPPQPGLNWSQYLRASDKNSHLGRQMNEKDSSKECNGTVAMSSEFPLSLDVVLDIFSVLEPLNPTLVKLRNLCNARLPPGFPVRVEMPIYATIQASMSFQHFNWCGSGDGAAPPLSAAMFKIPDNYHEDPKRFKRL